MGMPARDYRWADAEPGNTLAQKHGAWSDRAIAPVQAAIIEAATELVPFLDDPSYTPALQAWARVEARCRLVADYLDEHGLLDPESGKPRPAADLSIRLEKQAADARARLGLDPTSRARLEASLVGAAKDRVDIGAELARGRELRLAAAARLQDAQEQPDDADTGPDDVQDPREKTD